MHLTLWRYPGIKMSTAARDHVLSLPIFVSVLRAVQLLLGVILLGLAAYSFSGFVYVGFVLTLCAVLRLHLSCFA